MGRVHTPTLYFDVNVLSKLGRERLDLLDDLERCLTRERIRVVPASVLQIAECLQTPDEAQRMADLNRLHRWTRGEYLPSHNDVLASYVQARLRGSPTAINRCGEWTVEAVVHDRTRNLEAHQAWIGEDLDWAEVQFRSLQNAGIGGHTGDAIRAASEICIDIVRGLAERPEKVREFLPRAVEPVAISESDARMLGADSWIRFLYALRVFPSVHACFSGSAMREAKYAGDLGDWHHAVFARTADHVVSDDRALLRRWRTVAHGVGERVAVLSWPDGFATHLKELARR